MNIPKVTVHLTFTTIFYMILAYVLFHSIQTLLNEPTAFEETVLENKAEIPSLTICPYYSTPTNIAIESFEDILQGIQFEKKNFKTTIFRTRPFSPE